MQTNWNLNNLINLEAIDKELETVCEVTAAFNQKYSSDKTWLEDTGKFFEALKEYENLNELYLPLKSGYFAHLSSELNVTDESIKKLSGKIDESENTISNNLLFFELEISKLDINFQKLLLDDQSNMQYHHFLKKIFDNSKHILDESAEKVLTEMSSPAYGRWTKLLSEMLDSSFKELTINNITKTYSFTEISNLISSKLHAERFEGNKAFYEILNDAKFIAGHEFNAILNTKYTLGKLRKYNFVDESRHIHDDIETEFVRKLCEIVSKNFDIVHSYYKLKAKLTNQEILAYEDRNYDLGSIDIEFDFEAASNIVLDSFAKINPDYSKIIIQMLEEGRVDVYPKINKTSGAFCTHNSLNVPQFILLNHDNKLESLLTFAHEGGHAINHYYILNNNNNLNASNSLAIAETASTFFEAVALNHVSKDITSKKTILTLKLKTLSDDISTIFRQIAYYNAELDFHNNFKSAFNLSVDELNNIYYNNMKKFFGDFIQTPTELGLGWIYISHFRSPFYVYSYASGQLVSKAIYRLFKENNDVTMLNKFLSFGSSDTPVKMFKSIGIDIAANNFLESGINEIRSNLNECWDLAEELSYNLD